MKTRILTLYFRDEKGVMRAIPNLKAVVYDGNVEKLFTLDAEKELYL